MAVDHIDDGVTFAEKHLERRHKKLGDAAALEYASGMATAVCAWVLDKYGPEVASEMAQGLVTLIGSDFRIPAAGDEGQHGKN